MQKLRFQQQFLPLFLVLLSFTAAALAISCFKCSSLDGNNPQCEGHSAPCPSNNNASSAETTPLLQSPCMVAKKDYMGFYSATTCFRLIGVFADTGKSLIIRDCSLDSAPPLGNTTTETSTNLNGSATKLRCGVFTFNSQNLTGCLQSCTTDACN